ncbi:MAG TPA: hypothetical protein PLD59_06690 [Tepidisphaeraceae bacterium]|nr:hypothetical protein [Tepidisphaeraceae bacterium]
MSVFMEHSGVTVKSLGHHDLPGSMLRASFRRRGPAQFYFSPASALVMSLLTAGLFPTGLLLVRVWMYATPHRFRARELMTWLADGDRAISPMWRAMLARVRPTAPLAAAGGLWLIALGGAAVLVVQGLHWLAGGPPLPADARRSVGLLVAGAGSALASLALLLSTLQLRLHLWRLMARLPVLELDCRKDPARFDLPRWVVWPVAGAPVVLALTAGGWLWPAMWLMSSVVATLAAEVQRGYIIVADRRLRVAVARAIGGIMYGREMRR